MNRTETIRSAALIALPFLLLPAGVWASEAVNESTLDLRWWWVARWSLRAVYCGVAFASQLFNLFEAGSNGPGSPIIAPSMPLSLTFLGWVILSGLLLLPSLVQLFPVILRIGQTSARI